jgi:peptidoglycan/LPS O-acetylase OafA/YrhL
VVFHLFGNGRVSGGVDVFLVISGFLLTGSLIRSAQRRDLRLVDRYARTASRLLPPALIVLAGTGLLVWAVLPPSTWAQSLREILAAGLFYENWELISSQLAYGAAGPGTSALQHFWSLSVQGQYFLVWPALVVLLCRILTPRGARVALWVGATAAMTAAASFAFAMYLTAVDQPLAYFHSGSRYWELAIGALAAAALPYVRVPAAVRTPLAWTGLAGIVACGFIIDGGTLFPGPWTLVPVVSTLFVIFGSGGSETWGPARLLAIPPLRFIATISYAFYLWHWPLLIAFLAWQGRAQIGLGEAAALLAASVLLAWLTTRATDRPVQAYRRTVGPRVVLVTSALTAGALALGCVVSVGVIERRETAALAALEEVDAAAYPGAAVLTGAADAVAPQPVRPEPGVARKDKSSFMTAECVQAVRGEGSEQVETCTVVDSPDPTRTVVLAGGSHVMHWLPTFEQIARDRNWRLLLVGKHLCRIAVDLGGFDQDPTCWAWNVGAMETLQALDPDAVVVSGTRTKNRGRPERLQMEQVEAWRQLDAAGIPVLAIRDTPRFVESMPECVETTPDVATCGRPRQAALAAKSPLLENASLPDNVVPLDLSRYLCTDGFCPAVIGNVLVYQDKNHITGTYARSLTPMVSEALSAKAGWLFKSPPDA